MIYYCKKQGDGRMLWIVAAVFSAIFAGLTSILAKCGIKKTDSDLATALRTAVVLIFHGSRCLSSAHRARSPKLRRDPLFSFFCRGLLREHRGFAISRRSPWAMSTRLFLSISQAPSSPFFWLSFAFRKPPTSLLS